MPEKSNKSFLETFFGADGKHPHPDKALNHFQQAFVEPSYYERLSNIIKIDEKSCKVVILDGHPRTGKTWASLRATHEFIENYKLSSDEWMTTGVDSLCVYSDSEDLLEACRKVEAIIKKHEGSLRLIFLDDFLGTTKPRNFFDTINKPEVEKYFIWNNDNPWIRSLSNGSVLVMTGRSSFFALAEILWNINIREQNTDRTNPDKQITVINPRSGLFRNLFEGEIFGAFNRESLDTAILRNAECHPSKNDIDWMILNAPLMAFNPSLFTPDKKQLSAFTRGLAALSLFEEDIDTFSEYATFSISNLSEDVRSRMCIAYLVTIAPGLLFIGEHAYNALGVKHKEAIRIIEQLYWHEGHDKFKSGRIPNEFFMTAVRNNLKKNLALVANIFLDIVGRDNPDNQIGIRGIMERSLYEAANHNRNNKKTEPFDAGDGKVEELFPAKICQLFNISGSSGDWGVFWNSFSDAYFNFMVPNSISPGIAASLGFATYQFFNCETTSITVDKIKNYVSSQISTRFLQPGINLDRLIACYSSFLQWALRVEPCPIEGGIVDELMNIYLNRDSQSPGENRTNKLRMVLEDELFWAAQHWASKRELYDYSKLGSLNELLADTIADMHGTLEAGTLSSTLNDDDVWLNVNRYFTLVWHNEWMDRAEDSIIYFSPELALEVGEMRRWTNILKSLMETIISSKPNRLDSNLRYHWCHFITQYSVWMRNWTFSLDPHDEERNRVTSGSINPDNNQYFVDLCKALISNITAEDENIAGKRIRNVLFCIASRASRLDEGNMFELLSLIDSVCSVSNSDVLCQYVIQAIYELCRHGYLDPHAKSSTEKLSAWCRYRLKHIKNEGSIWNEYIDEIKKFTHPLDLIPTRWEDIRPDNWEN